MHRTRKALLASLLIAVSVSLGYALAGVPNVELMTITVFISGYLLGAGLGAAVGGVAIAVHSVFNPFGAALPPLLAAQIFGFVAVGVVGGVLGPAIARLGKRPLAALIAAGAGFLLTLLYDALTSIGAFFVMTGEDAPTNLVQFVTAGIVFMGMHLVWNTGLFLVTLKPILNVLAPFRRELL